MPLNAILDVDGTLVDTNYHHALAWHRALHSHGHRTQMWKIHRHIGMGGDQILDALIGERASGIIKRRSRAREVAIQRLFQRDHNQGHDDSHRLDMECRAADCQRQRPSRDDCLRRAPSSQDRSPLSPT